ncbi:hypothetical protein ACNHKD_09815 [Methylocystis sp. JAN1]|uniref:hypothetical protein n=1 Tax=Methylocystis sp. JAN1 TaxID=3397211 RepID=UPI003FA25673
MSPSETSVREGWLERPEGAFAHFQATGVEEVVREEKHMGSQPALNVRGHEPLRRIHECVFAVSAFESEPIDPRL